MLHSRIAVRRAFTLVELLAVIGIIGLLMAMLLPALSRARQASASVKCLASLRTIHQATQIHASEHRNYAPLAGWHFNLSGGTLSPESLGDQDRRRYTYFTDNGIERPAPITAALARALGVEVRLGSRAELEADLATDQVIRLFRCPSDLVPRTGLSQREDGPAGWTSPLESSSYVFNEAVLGKRNLPPGKIPPVMGNMALIRRTTEVMLAADGRPRNMTNDNWMMVFNTGRNDSLYDFLQTTLGDNAFGKETLDFERHSGRINVVFFDGHADAVLMTADGLRGIGVSRGVYE